MQMQPLCSIAVYLLAVIVTLAGSAHAQDDEWSLDGKGQYPPQESSDRIIKWCGPDGKERYASANLKIKGYEPCGKLQTTATCDASGTRLLAKDGERPEGHLDCSVGPRILIINHGEGGVDTSARLKDDEQVEPLSGTEQAELRKEVQAVEAQQQKDPMMQLNQAALMILQSLAGNNVQLVPANGSRPGRRSSRDRRKANNAQQKQLEEALRNLDPQTRRAILDMIAPQRPPRR